MLVVHPSSACDVCLEGYTGGTVNIPHAITCGHTFCLTCLQAVSQHRCPLCRSPFDMYDIRKLHVDRSIPGPPSPTPGGYGAIMGGLDGKLGLDVSTNHISPEALRLQRKITAVVRESSFSSGVPESGIRELIDEVHRFLGGEMPDKYADLRATFLLLYRFTESQGKCEQLEKSIHDLRAHKHLYEQATLEVERKYQDLQRLSVHDRETARAVETSLREHHGRQEAEWQKKFDFTIGECSKLRAEVESLRYSGTALNAPPPTLPSPSSVHFLDAPPDEVPKAAEKRKLLEGKALDSPVSYLSLIRDRMLHISPVPMTISVLPLTDQHHDLLSKPCQLEDHSAASAHSVTERDRRLSRSGSLSTVPFTPSSYSQAGRADPAITTSPLLHGSLTRHSSSSRESLGNAGETSGRNALPIRIHTPQMYNGDNNGHPNPHVTQLYKLLDSPHLSSSLPSTSSPIAERKDSQIPASSFARHPLIRMSTAPAAPSVAASEKSPNAPRAPAPSSRAALLPLTAFSSASQACSHLPQKSGPQGPATPTPSSHGAPAQHPSLRLPERRGSTGSATSLHMLRDAVANSHSHTKPPSALGHLGYRSGKSPVAGLWASQDSD